MCGKSGMVSGSGFAQRYEGGRKEGKESPSPENMSPKARIAASMSVLGPVVLSGIFLVVFVPQLWWVFTTYAWISFPAFGLLASGLTGLASSPSQKQLERSSTGMKEREILEALQDHAELTPAQAAMETSLSVSQADDKLKELAEGGHLEVRARGGGLFYALWGAGEIE